MCFSAPASFIAGGTLSAAGVGTLTQMKTRRAAMFAAIPLLFGVQQLIEGVVWVTFRMPRLHLAATYAYIMFSHVLWPVYMPIAVMLIEPGPRRRAALKVFAFIGGGVSLGLLSFVLSGPVDSVPGCCGIEYLVALPSVPLGLAAYVLAACASCLISSHKFVRVFGLALFGSLAIALAEYRSAFYSVWCFFAAILSLIIYVHLRHQKRYT